MVVLLCMKNFLKFFKVVALIIVLLFGVSLLFLSQQVGGIRAFVVQSASMEPTISTGSLILTKYIAPQEIKQKDIITFIRPDKNREFITHRVTKISQNDSLIILQTKGDNNKAADEWKLAGGGVIGKVVYTIPLLGYLFAFIQTKVGIFFFILLPAVYIIVDEIHTIITIIKDHRKKKTQPALEKD